MYKQLLLCSSNTLKDKRYIRWCYSNIVNINRGYSSQKSKVAPNLFDTENQYNQYQVNDITYKKVPIEQTSSNQIKDLLKKLNSPQIQKASTKKVVKTSTHQSRQSAEVQLDQNQDDIDNLEIYDEDEEQIVVNLDDQEDYDIETRLLKYENDDNRMEGMEDYVFDDDPNEEPLQSNLNKLYPKEELKMDTVEDEEYVEEDENVNEDSARPPLTKADKKRLKEKFQQQVIQDYGKKDGETILHKIELKKQFGKWEPKVKLSRKEMDELRGFHKSDPYVYTYENLSKYYGIAKEAVHRILTSKYQPDQKKLDKLHQKKVESNKEKYSPFSRTKKSLFTVDHLSKSIPNHLKSTKQSKKPTMPTATVNTVEPSESSNSNDNNVQSTTTFEAKSLNENNALEKHWYQVSKEYNLNRIKRLKSEKKEQKEGTHTLRRTNKGTNNISVDLKSGLQRLQQLEKNIRG
ncbi:neugrin domain-containing protein [Tieghemostelium lacteum]|uniref:Neugrin domain-containing protein n=1 Tax=Tieghemostelium lacteum TaxID=361077 RepID=A0A151Z7F9_TIELA|nr:neugrin domain-containing protein [Tieghemostelium lacteum]|eukprot:KYQ89724.1 neugrin domain-containing protein [Tieghemostelium lacteum]